MSGEPTGGLPDEVVSDAAAAAAASDQGTDPITGGPAASAEAAAEAFAASATVADEAVIENDAEAVVVEGDLDALGTVSRERDDYLDALRRLQADFENYKKRVAKHEAELADRAAERLVEKLLPVLDTADLAMAHGAGDGVAQIAEALREALSKEGLERVAVAGEPFDPTVHDAVAHEPGEGGDGQQVAEVLRAGYRWKGRVVRPAMVKVRG